MCRSRSTTSAITSTSDTQPALTETPTTPTYAVLLAGGRARRLGGVAKCLTEVDGEPLLGRLISSLRRSGVSRHNVAVVGGGADTRRAASAYGVSFVDDSARGGPAAALRLGWEALGKPETGRCAVLAGDLWGDDDAVDAVMRRLLRSSEHGVVGVRDDHPHWTCSAWPCGLFAALGIGGAGDGLSLHRLLGDAAFSLDAECSLDDLNDPDDLADLVQAHGRRPTRVLVRRGADDDPETWFCVGGAAVAR